MMYYLIKIISFSFPIVIWKPSIIKVFSNYMVSSNLSNFKQSQVQVTILNTNNFHSYMVSSILILY